MPLRRSTLRDRVQNTAIRSVLGAMTLLPYRVRVPFMGWITARIAAPLLGWTTRVRENLAHVMPDLSEDEVRRLTRAVPNNAGRTLIELYSGRAFTERVKDSPLGGPGLETLRRARAANRPTVVITAHFGSYDAARTVLAAHGHDLGGLYREMRNPRFNAHYVNALTLIGAPMFPTTRKGLAGLIGHLRGGGMIGILTDIYAGAGAPVTFFGKTAPTATSAMEWALKYDACVIPIYGRRRANGLDFDIIVDSEIPQSDPVTMTQAANDSLEAMVRQNMDQWFWIHRRWKPEDQLRRAAARTGP
ncbi:lysophospholipid acyltransferase family protein [Oceaniglobus indicus]|uniref:lysophospholipid acyltransferase family protein n=1 Tax=Oceaniglobus indicus TaxID=2047749 RepID=UPI000C1A3CFE|nr:lysophospholipid acyltransferase family protein [Oceaniglobus indicus]